MQKLSFQKTLVIGLTLFSMFFGAGNLIFAPYMGVQAGTSGPWALAGFICTAVILPISAILIISYFDDAFAMVSTISRKFAAFFVTLIYLLIGPCIAIPRTASTSFEMLVWLVPNTLWVRIVYTLLFFAAAGLCAAKPGKLKDILGRVMAPILVAMIVILCAGALFLPGQSTAPAQAYVQAPFLTGFVEGYQTMDILAAFCFGSLLLLNIKQSGIHKHSAMLSVLVKAALIAGALLASIYAMLTCTGMAQALSLKGAENGAQILSALAAMEFGAYGQILVFAIFLVACFNVCASLLGCCASYFEKLTHWKDYKTWLVLFTLAGALVSVFGLNTILSLSAPILSLICPVAIALLGWGLGLQIYRMKKSR